MIVTKCRRCRRLEKKQERELRHAEDALMDLKYELDKWGFSHKPSQIRRLREDIEYWKNRVDNLKNHD